ncbi:MAG: hypothetical protein J0I41_16505 [Filimonas sp.]|nr:hypothetical protein [Filimonas sp.]
MKTEILYVRTLQFDKVSYYTVKVSDRSYAEFEDFEIRLRDRQKQMAIIFRVIEQMGCLYGAKDIFFKKENKLQPYCFISSSEKSNLELRLCCIKISDEIVILLNGDIKTTSSIDKSVDGQDHLIFAEKTAYGILNAIKEGFLEINGNDFLIEDGFVLNI